MRVYFNLVTSVKNTGELTGLSVLQPFGCHCSDLRTHFTQKISHFVCVIENMVLCRTVVCTLLSVSCQPFSED